MFARKLRDGLLATAAAGALVLGAGSAQAATSAGVLFTGIQQLSDNSAEILIDNAGGATTLDVGDVLRGILDIQTTEQGAFTRQFGANGNNELTAIFEIEVVEKATIGGAFFGGICGSLVCFAFGPTASFEAEVESYGWTDGSGAMIAFFDDATVDFNRTGTVAAGEASATGGGLFWLFGLDGDDDFWVAGTITDDITVIQGIPAPGNGGTFNAGLSLLDRVLGPDLNPVLCNPLNGLGNSTVDACASGNVAAPLEGDFDIWDNVDITINVVPEPASLGLLGLGLLGLGFASRRRRNRQ
jgi:hypothetical protein